MQFVFPTFLWALLALAIPIIIHLFYFRRFKRVLFTNVKFLREVKEETSMRSRLRNLLVLAMRLLAVAFLVFAFAQPFIPQTQTVKTGSRAVSVFVDNSFSMSARSQDVPLLEKAKQRAREVINAFSVEDRFQVLTNAFEGRHQRLVGQEEALSLIDEIEIGPAVRELSTVAARQQQALRQAAADIEKLYLISDFQQNITDLTLWEDSLTDLSLYRFRPYKNAMWDSIAPGSKRRSPSSTKTTACWSACVITVMKTSITYASVFATMARRSPKVSLRFRRVVR
jgi:hypothetical protein